MVPSCITVNSWSTVRWMDHPPEPPSSHFASDAGSEKTRKILPPDATTRLERTRRGVDRIENVEAPAENGGQWGEEERGGGGGVDALSVQQGGIILIITIIMWLSQSSLSSILSLDSSVLFSVSLDKTSFPGLAPGCVQLSTAPHISILDVRRLPASSLGPAGRDHLLSPLKRVSRQDLSDSDNTKAVPFCSIFQSSVSSWGKPRRRRSYPLPLCIFAYPLPIALHFDNRWRPKQTAHQPKVGPLARINDRRGASTRLSRLKKKKKTIVSPQNALVRVGNSGSKQRGLP